MSASGSRSSLPQSLRTTSSGLAAWTAGSRRQVARAGRSVPCCPARWMAERTSSWVPVHSNGLSPAPGSPAIAGARTAAWQSVRSRGLPRTAAGLRTRPAGRTWSPRTRTGTPAAPSRCPPQPGRPQRGTQDKSPAGARAARYARDRRREQARGEATSHRLLQGRPRWRPAAERGRVRDAVSGIGARTGVQRGGSGASEGYEQPGVCLLRLSG